MIPPAAYLIVFLVPLFAACDPPKLDSRLYSIEGNPERGKELVRAYGCTACHQMPNIRAPTGRLGPPLHNLPERLYLAGRLPNRPDDLLRWIIDAPAIDPQTVMPNLGVTLADAHHIVAYLYEAD
jgi:hypothetical protein